MDLHDRQPGVGQGVPQRQAVVGQRPGVDDDRVGRAGRLLKVVDYAALVVGLEEVDLRAELFGPPADSALDLGQGRAAVLARVALAQHVQVGPVDDEYLHRSVLVTVSNAIVIQRGPGPEGVSFAQLFRLTGRQSALRPPDIFSSRK